MKILVTGASGFLGKFLCDYLEREGHDLTKLNSKAADLRKESSLSIYNSIQYDQIFHLAAWTQAGDFPLKFPGDQWLINQKINTNVLSWWKEIQPQAKMICMGTSCAYDPSYPLKEEYYLKGEPIESLFSYGMTKKMLLAGLISLNKQYNLNFLYFIPSTLYGKDYHTDGRQMHFIFDLIAKILRGYYYNEQVVLWGDGYQKRELIHVDDFVKYAASLSKEVSNEVLNLGEGEEHTIREYAQTLSDYIGYDSKKIIYDESRYVGARSKVLNVGKIRNKLESFEIRNYQEGLKEVVDWFKENKEQLLVQ